MASPAAAILPRIAARSFRLLINFGALLISAAVMVIIHIAARSPACSLVAFLIFVLGVSLVTLALAVTAQQQQQLDGSALPSKMENPAALAAHMPAASATHHTRAPRCVRLIIIRPQLIAETAALLISTAVSVVVGAAVNPSAVDGSRALFLATFVLFLLGVWLALLAIGMADRVPEAEMGTVAIA